MVARLFFSASGRLLNIEDAHTPVLVLKLNHGMLPPREHFELLRQAEANQASDDLYSRLSDPDNIEWLAFELYDAPIEVDDDTDAESVNEHQEDQNLTRETGTLSLLEYIMRLTALQTCEQMQVLDIPDERIALFLRDDSRPARYRRRQTSFSTPMSQSLTPDASTRKTPKTASSESVSFTPWEKDRLRLDEPSPLVTKLRREGGGDGGLRRQVRLDALRGKE